MIIKKLALYIIQLLTVCIFHVRLDFEKEDSLTEAEKESKKDRKLTIKGEREKVTIFYLISIALCKKFMNYNNHSTEK